MTSPVRDQPERPQHAAGAASSRRPRWLPQTVRVRLTVLYAALFLGAGALLLGLTYGLLASSLPAGQNRAGLGNAEQQKLLEACKAQSAAGHVPTPSASPGTKPVPRPVNAACETIFRAGATAATATQRQAALHNLLVISLSGLAALTLASAGLGWLMAGRALRPVSLITAAAQRASERHLGERVALQGPQDELKVLADTFDDMLERLDAAFVSQRRFIADASHELRTPLTVIRTAIDVALSKPDRTPAQLEAMARKVRTAVDRADALIGQLLTLAATESGVRATERTDLADLAGEALDAVRAAAAERDLRVEADLGPARPAGDPLLLEHLVGNLVENAVGHNQTGGWLLVRSGTGPDDEPFVTVANSGPIIPAGTVDGLFEPFRRAAGRTNSRDGVGLGLAIVKSIALAHGARVHAGALPEGGMEITVTFPDPSTREDAGESAGESGAGPPAGGRDSGRPLPA
jgi:signal transduction histidine kinase